MGLLNDYLVWVRKRRLQHSIFLIISPRKSQNQLVKREVPHAEKADLKERKNKSFQKRMALNVYLFHLRYPIHLYLRLH